MDYDTLVKMMAKIDAKRVTLIVHPDDVEKVREAVRQIGDEGLGRGQPIVAPNIVAHQYAEPGQVLVMAPKGETSGR